MNISSHCILSTFSKLGQFFPDGSLSFATTNSRTLFYPLVIPFLKCFLVPSNWISLYGGLFYNTGGAAQSVINLTLPNATSLSLYDSAAVRKSCKPLSIILY